MKFKYADLVPPLSDLEFATLKADIKENGVRFPVLVDEDGEVLDGKHRLKCDKNAPRKIIRGLTEAEKVAFVLRSALNTRNLSSDQKRELEKPQRETMFKLREENPKKWIQARVAAALGVDRSTVSRWWDITNVHTHNSYKPDARVKVSPAGKVAIVGEIAAGKTQEQVAANYGITQPAVHKIVSQAREEAEKERERKKRLKEAAKLAGGDDLGVVHGDFVDVAQRIPDGTLELIFTDPPYADEYLPLYESLGQVAAAKLQTGGSLLTYCGQKNIGRVISFMESAGLRFFWPVCVHHAEGPLAQMRPLGVVVNWKPVLWFINGSSRLHVKQFVNDYYRCDKPEKDWHPWQQQAAVPEYYIRHLTSKNSLVFDPFCGGGTTAVAAKMASRKWLTCDKDNDAVLLARKRVAEVGPS